ncbi:MAG: T9SS type A sorting domain-containing protein, partial [Lentimicrobium sp.]|nr:T9SS type A sorting domain-containing protein [Lentimicrobium sp.]
MKKRFLLASIVFAFLYLSPTVKAQFSVLFVNDNSVFYPNTETVLDNLQQISATDYFNSVDSLRGPTYAEMYPYDLIIWYTSTDGLDRYFWSGTDSDNEDLKLYMQDGGMLWVMGNDFLYDRYGAAPVDFVSGDFPLDYLGIQQYAAQSYGDDGNSGLPMLTLEENNLINEIPDTLQWIYETLWWADGCIPETGVTPFYRMGPDSYILSSYFSAFASEQDRWMGTTVTLLFDPALIDTDENRISLFEGIIDYFTAHIIDKVVALEAPVNQLRIFPNPSKDLINIGIVNSHQTLAIEISIFDFTGREVLSQKMETSGNPLDISILDKGIYMVKAFNGQQIYAGKFIKE